MLKVRQILVEITSHYQTGGELHHGCQLLMLVRSLLREGHIQPYLPAIRCRY